MSKKIISPQAFLKIRAELASKIEKLENQISQAFDAARRFPLPSNLRPAVSSDIREYAIIWYKRALEDGGNYWLEVDDVLHPDDDFKAFMSGGARYGLFNAFVETDVSSE
jgi:hypothetical protein